jgi:hypothetical protein
MAEMQVQQVQGKHSKKQEKGDFWRWACQYLGIHRETIEQKVQQT